jgi:hypothetical protein
MRRCLAAGDGFIKPAIDADDLLMAAGLTPPAQAFFDRWLSESLIVAVAGLTIERPFYMFYRGFHGEVSHTITRQCGLALCQVTDCGCMKTVPAKG